VRREQERHRALCHTVSVASTRTPSVAAVVASGTGAPYRGGVCCGSQGHAFVRDPRRLRAMRRCRSWIAIALEYRTGTWYRAGDRAIWRSGDRAIYAATPRIAALLQSSYIVYDLAIWRTTLQRYVLLVPANRCDASLLVHRLRSSDRLCDAAWLLVPATRPCAIHHPSTAIGRPPNRFGQLYCFPVLETRPCAIRGPSSAIGRPRNGFGQLYCFPVLETRSFTIHHPSSAIGRPRNRFCSSAVSRY